MSSENPAGADNQQERLLVRLQSSFFDTTALHSAQEESSEAIRRAPLGSEWMKRWSGPHGDMGKTVPNYNRPKVDDPCVQQGVLPLPTVTLVSAAGYLLENPEASVQYSSRNPRQ